MSRRAIKRTLLCAGLALAAAALVVLSLIAWPAPLFAHSIGTGKIVIASDRPIPAAGGERLIRDCQRLLDRSPLRAESPQYRIYITNTDWRRRLFSSFMSSYAADNVS